ncbi:MAG: RimK/LysX family protein [Aquimonas sp.]|nr:RimK/LysX family protein [Aquimonas sp.]
MAERALILLGWCEWVALPELGITAIRAKIDTGARSSSLHVDAQESFQQAGREWVRFRLHLDGAEAREPVECRAPVHDRRAVRDSGGHVTERVFILNRVALAGQDYPIELNLAARRGLKFPLLLGRTALADRFLVDAAHRGLLGGEPL